MVEKYIYEGEGDLQGLGFDGSYVHGGIYSLVYFNLHMLLCVHHFT